MFWTEAEVAIILEMFSDHTAVEIAEKLQGRTSKMVGAKVTDLRKRGHTLKKSAYFEEVKSKKITSDSGTATRFKKGNVPHNKGTKGKGVFMVGGNKTTFRKGLRPHNTVAVGTIADWCGGRGKYHYLRIKVGEPNKWEQLHRWVWIQTFGAIPNGYLVKFKDSNYKNCEPENLYLQDKQGNMLQNSIHNYPQDIQDVMRLVKKLKKTIIKKAQENG